jgi:hypothetical protein
MIMQVNNKKGLSFVLESHAWGHWNVNI